MKSHLQTNKNKSNPKSKSRSNSKSKSKSKNSLEFDPIKFLNKAIDMPVGLPIRNKKNRSREIGSAMTAATPILSLNVSTSKLRCKSSYSQYRARNSGVMKDLANINFKMYITEQDNIKYTQTATHNVEEHEKKEQELKKLNRYPMSQNNAAIIIQRAWKNYQTLKMVKMYQQIFDKEKKPSQTIERKKDNYQIQLEKTLKIRPSKQSQQHCTVTQKNSKEKLLIPEIIANFLSTPSPKNNKSKNILQIRSYEEEKSKQIEKLSSLMKIISSSRQRQSNEAFILQDIREKIEKNKSCLLKEIQKQSVLQVSLCNKKNKDMQEEISNSQLPLASNICNFEQINSRIQQSCKTSQLKVLTNKINALYETKQLQIQKYTILKSINRISEKQYQRKVQQLTKRYNNEIQYIHKTKKQYEMYMKIMERIAIDSHKSFVQNSSSKKYIKKAFSAENIIFKCVLTQNKIQEMDVEFPLQTLTLSRNTLLLSKEKQKNQQQPIHEESTAKKQRMISNQSVQSPSIHESSEGYVDLLNDQDELPSSKSQILQKKYTQDMQQQVENILIQQLLCEIYLSQKMYQQFKPYIQKNIKFHPITDFEIFEFFDQLLKYSPPRQKLIKLFNQKINPASWQILRIIRDPQYELEDYELILNEEVFKKYRVQAQLEFQKRKQITLTKIKQISFDRFFNEDMKKIAYQRKQEHVKKLQRYLIFGKDIRLIYMRAVFNCLNQYLIESISFSSFMNGRSSIGPGQLKNALKQYNKQSSEQQISAIFRQVESKLRTIIKYKCIIPTYKNYPQMIHSQEQAQKQIKLQLEETQFKWVNYMDEVLEIWQEIYFKISEQILSQAVSQILALISI